jgi:hypothetical protein
VIFLSDFFNTFSNTRNIQPQNNVSIIPENNASNQQNNLKTTPQNSTGTPSPNNTSKNLQNNELQNGYLQILTQDIVERRNLAGVNVTVLTANEDKVLYELVTDTNGLTKTVSLPAPSIRYSLDKKNLIVPYLNYTVRIKYAGYSSIIYKDIPIYAETTFLQICYLTLLPENLVIFPPHILLE